MKLWTTQRYQYDSKKEGSPRVCEKGMVNACRGLLGNRVHDKRPNVLTRGALIIEVNPLTPG